jgi:hypothetical protein
MSDYDVRNARARRLDPLDILKGRARFGKSRRHSKIRDDARRTLD